MFLRTLSKYGVSLSRVPEELDYDQLLKLIVNVCYELGPQRSESNKQRGRSPSLKEAAQDTYIHINTATSISISNPEKKDEKSFTFDYVYGTDSQQDEIFKDLGIICLENAWAGFNCTLFAYGQTGSDKSYSMTGNLNPSEYRKELIQDQLTQRDARVNLVDLAGSERLSQTETTGERLTEACVINRKIASSDPSEQLGIGETCTNVRYYISLNQGDPTDPTVFQGKMNIYTHELTELPHGANEEEESIHASGDFAFSAESSTVWMYESEWYDSGQLVPDQVTPASDELPIVNGTAAAGNSTSYSRGDHVHPQQLTYDGNVTATKFINSGGTASEVLCANGDTTTIDNKISRTYNSSGGGWIRLCVFPAGASVSSPFIEFKVYSQYNAVQTIRLVPYYTVNGINSIYGVFTAPTKVSANYVIDSGVNQLFHTRTGSSSSAVYAAYVRIESTNSITIVVSDQSTYYTNRITEVLTQDVVSSVSSATQIPITYDLGNGGIINNMLQVNPTGRTYTTYNNGCATSAINTTQAGQWEISKTNDNALTINPSSLRQADHSVGLSINGDIGTPLYINQRGSNLRTQFPESKLVTNYVLNAGSPDSFAGVTCGAIQINPSTNQYSQGIRISRSTNTNYSGIFLGCDPNSSIGTLQDQWNIVNTPTGELRIGVYEQVTENNRGLMISADGNTLTFNGRVL
ncbi:MAG: hypothetical protein EZS28_009023 [Streblomastix strix]|uniref:Kinesin-like protein n=1 Tax=Streblomastix strix TaxID=222440 RepID=A0A5J4WLL7_9EUKA|nr:MAG: hypothetical protein EZS28_009023 [Streblomastix strix]